MEWCMKKWMDKYIELDERTNGLFGELIMDGIINE